MSHDPIARLATLQHPDGGFDSVVTMRDGECTDRNGFTTAIVLRTLRHVPGAPPLAALRRRALDFLEGCESREVPGAYGFWPERLRPAWAAAVPADVDDTAIILCELHRHGRHTWAEAMRALCLAILPCRVPPGEAMRPPWIADGSFHTWIAACAHERACGVQVVDCCVNANVAALMASLSARHLPGYVDAVRTVRGGLDWAGADATRLDSLTPFYPSARALADAVEHAVECGADELEGALEGARSLADRARLDEGCCRSAYGHAVWRCAALDVACGMAAAAA